MASKSSSSSETPGQLKQRHKLELRTLQNDVKNVQKQAKKERLSKKETDARVESLERAVKERHAAELAALEEEQEEEGGANETSTATSADAAAVAEPAAPAKPQGPSKAQRRREKLKKQEQERRERIEEENKHTVNERQVEADIILRKLQPLGLAIKDIPSDGHCMYHAVVDQMRQHGLPLDSDEPAFKHLRRLTGDYMRARPDDYLPFLALDEDSGKSSHELFEEYCERVVSTSDWGGQLELRALACALETPIHVFSAESDVIAMGQEFGVAGERQPLQLTYHLHYYTLGEHFNSVAPAAS